MTQKVNTIHERQWMGWKRHRQNSELDEWIRQLDQHGGTVNQQLVWSLATARMQTLKVPRVEQERWKRHLAEGLRKEPDIPVAWEELQQHPQRDTYAVLVVALVPVVGWFEDGMVGLQPYHPTLLRYRTVAEDWRDSWRQHAQSWMVELIQVIAWWRASPPTLPREA
jgi:hypothetical protein